MCITLYLSIFIYFCSISDKYNLWYMSTASEGDSRGRLREVGCRGSMNPLNSVGNSFKLFKKNI